MRAKTRSKLLGESLQMPNSLWAQTAPSLDPHRQLTGHESADVLIIGAGFTGLCAAIELAEAGKQCVVVDAAEPGWGASGRNNGQVIAGLKHDPDVIERLLPGEAGRKLVEFGSNAPSEVYNLIRRYQIECNLAQSGWIQPALTRSGMRAVADRAQAWLARGVNTSVLNQSELSILLGTSLYASGWLDPRGGCVQPLSYARGLARVAETKGVKLFGESKVISLARSSARWQAICERGAITAQNIIVATGAYADKLVPGLRESIVPVRTAQIATRVLPPSIRSMILPQGHVASDTRQLLTSFRLSPDGRLVMGGSGATAGLSHSGIVPYLQAAGEQAFGHLGHLGWEFQWSGFFAVTTDHLPHIHEPEKDMHIAVGCNGRGIAVSTSIGKQLARRVLGVSRDALPIAVSDMRPIRFHPFRFIGVKAATLSKRLQDRVG